MVSVVLAGSVVVADGVSVVLEAAGGVAGGVDAGGVRAFVRSAAAALRLPTCCPMVVAMLETVASSSASLTAAWIAATAD